MPLAATCATPKPNNWPRMVTRRLRVSSSPIENIRNTTPSSARPRTLSTSDINPAPCGPMAAPATR